jgi:hypothetical protein
MPNINDCLNNFTAKYEALKDLMQVMAKHNLTFESDIVYDTNYGEITELRILQNSGKPCIIFKKTDNKHETNINYLDISNG